jgi:hypothetical protein
MGKLADEWKKIKSAHKELGNTAKFKPDLGAIVARYEESLRQRDIIEKRKSELDGVRDQIKAWQRETAAKIKPLLVEVTRVQNMWIQNMEASASFSDAPSVSNFTDFCKDMSATVTDRSTKSTTALDERDKALVPLSKQYIQLMNLVDAAEKKNEPEVRSTLKQTLDVIRSYRSIASQMNADKLVDSIDDFRAKFPGLLTA